MMSHDTKSSKVSRKSNIANFYPKNLIHAFIQKPNFEECRCEGKQKFEGSQSYVVEDGIEEADNPSGFMKMIRARTDAALSAKDEKRQVLPSRVIWDGNLDCFEEFRNKVEGHYGQIGASYLFDMDFQEAYLEKV